MTIEKIENILGEEVELEYEKDEMGEFTLLLKRLGGEPHGVQYHREQGDKELTEKMDYYLYGKLLQSELYINGQKTESFGTVDREFFLLGQLTSDHIKFPLGEAKFVKKVLRKILGPTYFKVGSEINKAPWNKEEGVILRKPDGELVVIFE